MTDIVERLLRWEDNKNGPDVRAAADEIERLRGLRDVIRRLDDEIERLTARPADELLLEENKLMRAALLSQSDEIERLKAQLARTETALDNEFNNGIALCAEIERLKMEAKVMK